MMYLQLESFKNLVKETSHREAKAASKIILKNNSISF
jgi:hypothetical protein